MSVDTVTRHLAKSAARWHQPKKKKQRPSKKVRGAQPAPVVVAQPAAKPKPERSWTRPASCSVYGLALIHDPNVIRYVGQTRNKIETRLKYHLAGMRKMFGRPDINDMKPTALQEWLWSYQGYVFPVLLEAKATWDVSEILWIADLRRKGYPLLNVLDGGSDTRDDYRRRKRRPAHETVGVHWGNYTGPDMIRRTPWVEDLRQSRAADQIPA